LLVSDASGKRLVRDPAPRIALNADRHATRLAREFGLTPRSGAYGWRSFDRPAQYVGHRLVE